MPQLMENVILNKKLTLLGEGIPTIDAQGSGSVIIISADYVNISGFTVKGSNKDKGNDLEKVCGIYLSSANYCTISQNMVMNNGNGVLLFKSSFNNIEDNNLNSNKAGIGIVSSSNNSIKNNICSNTEYGGIGLRKTSNNEISNNDIKKSGSDGISLYESSNNKINNNDISFSDSAGIDLFHAPSNIIWNNKITNSEEGIWLSSSGGSKIYLNNFINNKKNAYSYLSYSTWNSPEKVTYTYKRKLYTNYLGNYWSDYNGSDEKKDGIGDSPYDIYGGPGPSLGGRDKYPIMAQWENYFEREISTLSPTPTEIPTEEEATPEIPTGEEKGMPGFEVVVAIIGLLAVAYIFRRRK